MIVTLPMIFFFNSEVRTVHEVNLFWNIITVQAYTSRNLEERDNQIKKEIILSISSDIQIYVLHIHKAI